MATQIALVKTPHRLTIRTQDCVPGIKPIQDLQGFGYIAGSRQGTEVIFQVPSRQCVRA